MNEFTQLVFLMVRLSLEKGPVAKVVMHPLDYADLDSDVVEVYGVPIEVSERVPPGKILALRRVLH